MSLEFGISVIPMCQLNREGAKANREPELCDLRDSGSLEQDADNVWFLHQSDLDDGPRENPNVDELKIIIAKQRNGPTGFLKFKYYKNLFAFYDN
jgi:replicative DNA helicase